MSLRSWFILAPVLIVSVALTVANQQTATFSLDPFSPGDPAVSFEAPLIVWLFLFSMAGFVVGAFGMWLSGGGLRKRASERKREVKALRREVATASASASTELVRQ